MPAITDDLLNRGKTKSGSWTRLQFEIIGLNWKKNGPKRGWKKKVIGKSISYDERELFLLARNVVKHEGCSYYCYPETRDVIEICPWMFKNGGMDYVRRHIFKEGIQAKQNITQGKTG